MVPLGFSTYNVMPSTQNRNAYQWDRLESPEINPHAYVYLICDKGGKTYNGELTVSSISGAGEN